MMQLKSKLQAKRRNNLLVQHTKNYTIEKFLYTMIPYATECCLMLIREKRNGEMI
jgi:hypothetical protein